MCNNLLSASPCERFVVPYPRDRRFVVPYIPYPRDRTTGRQHDSTPARVLSCTRTCMCTFVHVYSTVRALSVFKSSILPCQYKLTKIQKYSLRYLSMSFIQLVALKYTPFVDRFILPHRGACFFFPRFFFRLSSVL